MTFGVDPDTHIDSLEQAEHATVEGTSKWSCKLTITGTQAKPKRYLRVYLMFYKHIYLHIYMHTLYPLAVVKLKNNSEQ